MLAGSGNRHVLFLQGTGSLFFWRLAKSLSKLNVKTSKIRFCFSDKIFWPSPTQARFNAKFSTWEDYLSKYLISQKISDIVLFSDSRPYHQVAVKVAKTLGVNVFVYENGYLRPNWITMELNGVNGRSPFPKDIEAIKALADIYKNNDQTPAVLKPVSPFRQHIGDTMFHAVNFWTKFYHPHYENYRKTYALKELYGWTKRVFQHRPKVKRSKAAFARLKASKAEFFLFPLQLENDYQLLIDSKFSSVQHACDEIINSFAQHAKSNQILVIKNHPLDNNYTNWEKEVQKCAASHNISDRVVFLETAHNPSLLENAKGMVTINSTMGTSALHHSLPLCVLGQAVYKISGLVHDGGLDSFWQNPSPVDSELYETFKRALIGQTQIPGRFSTQDPHAPIYIKSVTKILSKSFRPAGLNTVSSSAVDTNLDAVNMVKSSDILPAE